MTIRWVPAAAGAFVFAFATHAGATEPGDKAEGTGDDSVSASASVGADDEAAHAKPKDDAKEDDWDPNDPTEKEHQKYYFVGLRYRGNVVPKFIENLFVDEGGTIYSNAIGVEMDMRKDGFSLIPALTYQDYNSGNILFHQKNDPTTAGYYSIVNSSLKALYLTLDVLWSVPLAKDVDFEYGLGVGIGAVFGNLTNDWAYTASKNTPGAIQASTGTYYAECYNTSQGDGCNPQAHTNPTPHKVGGYTEPNWFNSGSVPTIFPWISIPQLGIRFKPLKQLETRLGVGFSLTGFWFGLSADYGLEHRPDHPQQASGSAPAFRFGGGN